MLITIKQARLNQLIQPISGSQLQSLLPEAYLVMNHAALAAPLVVAAVDLPKQNLAAQSPPGLRPEPAAH